MTPRRRAAYKERRLLVITAPTSSGPPDANPGTAREAPRQRRRRRRACPGASCGRKRRGGPVPGQDGAVPYPGGGRTSRRRTRPARRRTAPGTLPEPPRTLRRRTRRPPRRSIPVRVSMRFPSFCIRSFTAPYTAPSTSLGAIHHWAPHERHRLWKCPSRRRQDSHHAPLQYRDGGHEYPNMHLGHGGYSRSV